MRSLNVMWLQFVIPGDGRPDDKGSTLSSLSPFLVEKLIKHYITFGNNFNNNTAMESVYNQVKIHYNKAGIELKFFKSFSYDLKKLYESFLKAQKKQVHLNLIMIKPCHCGQSTLKKKWRTSSQVKFFCLFR